MNSPFDLNEKRIQILNTEGHLLIEGGPGAGKTTIALLKAKGIIDQGLVGKNQKILFLSFARATISRVEEQARDLVPVSDKKQIEINTYHGFSWSIIQSFGYLLNRHKYLKLITPPNLSAQVAGIPESDRNTYKSNLLSNDGVICFDLFSGTAASILGKSKKILSIISNAYPFIIVDEFQDTDDNEWKLIQLLGISSTIIALADLQQRIYEFRGASISRIPDFTKTFQCIQIDLGTENNRSPDTDITTFGNDILLGNNKGKTYQNVAVVKYPFYQEIKSNLKYALQKSIARLKKSKPDGNWSIAVLVKTRQDTLSVSSYLSSLNFHHDVLIDPAGPSLAASVIAKVLEYNGEPEELFLKHLLRRILNHIKGRKERASQTILKLCTALEKYLETGKITGSTRVLLIEEIKQIISKRKTAQLLGSPVDDWISVRKYFQEASHDVLKNIFSDAQFLRLLNRGAILSERLAEMWRSLRNYTYASQAVDDALATEHFSMSHRVWKGVVVMNIHKSKGKEFDEVIIWEEPYKPLVYENSIPSRIQQDKLLLRVAATRAKSNTTFLTPASAPCILL